MTIGKSYWIWHYGEYEIYHTMKANLRRREYGMDYPAFWHISSPYVNVKFKKEINSPKDGYLVAHISGKGLVRIDGKKHPPETVVHIPAGRHTVEASVFNENGLPAIFVESDICQSGADWQSSHAAGKYLPVGYRECFDSPDKSPEVFPYSYEKKLPVRTEKTEKGILYDFGTELFAYLNIKNADPSEKYGVFFGESREEATDGEEAIVFEYIGGKDEYRLTGCAFRYVHVDGGDESLEKLEISADTELLPLEKRGNFCCDNELFNKIYDTSAYTFLLNCREGFFDGIKRDRWIWSGDAYQSARINAYLYADTDIVKRTAIGLIGKEPFEQHINTIVDYSLLWLIGLYDYYMTYGDADFPEMMYGKACALMELCESRLNENGFIVGTEEDWTFIDWSDIDKTGAVCAEQMLLAAAYSAMSHISRAIGADGESFAEKSRALKEKIDKYYWNDSLGAYIDSYESGRNNVTRHANIFAVMYDIAAPEKVESIKKNVLKNDAITKITTPYFEGYELDVLGKLGEFDAIEKMLDSYWGGMIRLGADTIWEEYDPTMTGTQHLAMYGKKYGKSLCHAWGAGPVYLFGRYYLGVYPTKPGFSEFRVEPNLGGLGSICGRVPAGNGEVRVSLDSRKLSVTATIPGGTLVWRGKEYKLTPDEPIELELV